MTAALLALASGKPRIGIEMSPFRAWMWQVYSLETGLCLRRFKDDDALDRWLGSDRAQKYRLVSVEAIP